MKPNVLLAQSFPQDGSARKILARDNDEARKDRFYRAIRALNDLHEDDCPLHHVFAFIDELRGRLDRIEASQVRIQTYFIGLGD